MLVSIFNSRLPPPISSIFRSHYGKNVPSFELQNIAGRWFYSFAVVEFFYRLKTVSFTVSPTFMTCTHRIRTSSMFFVTASFSGTAFFEFLCRTVSQTVISSTLISQLFLTWKKCRSNCLGRTLQTAVRILFTKQREESRTVNTSAKHDTRVCPK